MIEKQIKETIERVYGRKFPTHRELKDIDYLTELLIKLFAEQLHKSVVVRSLPFVTWLFSNYQMFHDRWIKLTGNGHYENPYTTGQPALTWEEVIKEYELRQ